MGCSGGRIAGEFVVIHSTMIHFWRHTQSEDVSDVLDIGKTRGIAFFMTIGQTICDLNNIFVVCSQ